MRRLIDKMGLSELTNAYGMTETSPVSFQTTPNDPILKRVETVGKVSPHVQAKLLDPQGNVVPVNTPGEVCIAGYLLQKGYWEDQEQTDRCMKKDENGTLWMHTGDEGIMDEEGYLKIVGRIKDIIIRGGENLFPVQIENVLSTNHGIEESAIVSVPDDKYGEVVGAWVVRSRSEKGSALTREAVRATVVQGMNPQNAPAYVWFLGEDGAPDALPKTASGKVMKHVLREWSREMKKKGIGKASDV
jgi:acyl-CoA synthetase (AMP-forming)/AMP-acid ligase II